MSEANDREHAADGRDDTSGEESGVNRQFVLGGIIVAVTLAIAAWLAYGVVQRSSTTAPRRAAHTGRGERCEPHHAGPPGPGRQHIVDPQGRQHQHHERGGHASRQRPARHNRGDLPQRTKQRH